jgi:hypothetical protein
MSVFLNVVFCQVEVSATGQSLVRMSPKECSVPECDLETSTMRRPRLSTHGITYMKVHI